MAGNRLLWREVGGGSRVRAAGPVVSPRLGWSIVYSVSMCLWGEQGLYIGLYIQLHCRLHSGLYCRLHSGLY